MLVMLRYYFLTLKKETPQDITTKDTIILDETEASTSTKDTATNTIPKEQKADDISTLIVRKFNDLSDKVEKRLHNTEDQIIGMQLSNLLGNNLSGKAVTLENFCMQVSLKIEFWSWKNNHLKRIQSLIF